MAPSGPRSSCRSRLRPAIRRPSGDGAPSYRRAGLPAVAPSWSTVLCRSRLRPAIPLGGRSPLLQSGRISSAGHRQVCRSGLTLIGGRSLWIKRVICEGGGSVRRSSALVPIVVNPIGGRSPLLQQNPGKRHPFVGGGPVRRFGQEPSGCRGGSVRRCSVWIELTVPDSARLSTQLGLAV